MHNTQPVKIHHTAAHLCELSCVCIVSGLSTPRFRSTVTYQHQPIGTWVHLGVLGDVPVGHPRSHHAQWKQCSRNLDDWEQVRMRVDLAFFSYTAIDLVWRVLSTSEKDRRVTHLFDFHQGSSVMCPNHLNTHRLPTIISLPDISEPTTKAAWGFVVQFYTGEGSRFTEEGVGVESEPKAQDGIRPQLER